ncbi:cysteine proteinase, partial [Wolfiporia cocos MD-104 SS10]
MPAGFSEDATQYRPVENIDAFKNLFPPPIEFVEGSSSGSFVLDEGKYQPINSVSTAPRTEVRTEQPPEVLPSVEAIAEPQPQEAKPTTQPAPSTAKAPKLSHSTVAGKDLYSGNLNTTWPSRASIGAGLQNTGNTCFLNSALQCLLHTPPLLHILQSHSQTDPFAKNAFCMTCGLRQVMLETHERRRSYAPYPIVTKLQVIAKSMRRGRQEDAHEFLRYAIDALQKSCLAGHPAKIDPKLAETTWVHKIFGGRLRSRVTCLDCGYNSDTFDRILDLSIDIYGVNTLKEALRKFVAVDHLKGADKYKCEKCKKPVTADKQFTLHEAPLVLTIHLKRFSPMGRKIGHPVKYDERLSLQPIMSDGQYGPTYSLYGIISHAGGGPNSGHYYAHVKSADGHWYEMNDESVSRQFGSPTTMKNAYILFYIR